MKKISWNNLSDKRLLLICPKFPASLNTKTNPLSMALIAGCVESIGCVVSIFDENVKDSLEQSLKSFKPNIVGITSTSSNVKRGLEIAKYIKEHDKSIQVIFGGIHATILPEEILRSGSVDVVVCGEGEITIMELMTSKRLVNIKGISYMYNGKIHHNETREKIQDLDSIPFPAYHMLDLKDYNRVFIMSSRGCPGHCTFCGSHILFGRKIRFRSPEKVVDEMELVMNYGIKDISFMDDTLTIDKKHIHGICDEIIKRKLNIKWSCMSRVNNADINTFKKMKKAGCYSVGFGIESADPKVIQSIKKGITMKDAENAIRMCKDAGLKSKAFFMVGLPNQTWESIIMTVKFIEKVKPYVSHVSILVPFPDTEIYNDLREGGVIKDDEQLWDKFVMRTECSISTPQMIELSSKICLLTKEEIINGYNLIASAGFKASTIQKLKSPMYVLGILSRLRSFNDIKNQARRILSLFGKRGLEEVGDVK